MKAYLSKEKIIAWFMKNNPEEFLLAKLNDGQRIDKNTSYDTSWIEMYNGQEVSIDERNKLILRFSGKEETRFGEGYDRMVSLQIFQPEKDAWIEWRDV
jgi:hypothetical protein